MKKISIQEAKNVPFEIDLSKSKEENAQLWLLKLREYLLQNKVAEFGNIIPNKKEIAEYLNLGIGTVQNALKHLEDKGFFESKQCIGTMIKDENKAPQIKMVSKKEKCILEIKKYLSFHKYEKGEILPSISFMALELKVSKNTVRLAFMDLMENGVILKDEKNNSIIYILNSDISVLDRGVGEVKNKNLVKILKEDIKKYLYKKFKTGDKIPTNKFFSDKYKVSIRTINMCFRELNRENVIFSRRGNYGSILLEKGDVEKSKAFRKIASNYKWEDVLFEIRNYILKNFEAGDKIPSIKEFGEKFKVSTTTVKKAVQELSKDGILYAQKGKYGGLFVVEMPEKEDSYRWLAVNPEYF